MGNARLAFVLDLKLPVMEAKLPESGGGVEQSELTRDLKAS